MKINKASITILVDRDGCTIELRDDEANTSFAKATLTAEQFATCLGRQAQVSCEINVRGLDRIGKKMEHKRHEFICPDCNYYNRQEVLSAEILKTLPDGWISDNNFSSQNTFFEKDGVKYAQTTIRRWL